MRLYCFRFEDPYTAEREQYIYKIFNSHEDPYEYMKEDMAIKAFLPDYLITIYQLPVVFESIEELRRRHGNSRFDR